MKSSFIWRLPGPPAFAREASEGCRAEAHLGEGGRGRELRLGKPACDHHRESSPQGRAPGSRSQPKYRKQPHAK